ncbi:DUF2975 domain-containing protein [Streptomyces sp. NPDC088387]|uniref:DUF2975 domain-containing protein n=1 Tax=Streptomyces sp. NPDC088387 TaxID=3365859 RepID=UPI0037F89E82
MAEMTVRALRAVIAVLLAGSVFFQVLVVTLLFVDPEEGGELAGYQRVFGVVIVVLGFVAAEAVLLCVWKLVTMARRGTVFSDAAFRYVDIVVVAFVAAAVLVLALGTVLAPGEAVAPGLILLAGGFALAVLGVGLIVLVLRTLLAQAVAREIEAARMRTELEGVI